MYLPYLRGKQFELIALREFAERNSGSQYITPIIEPVKCSYNSLTTAVTTMFRNDLKFALVLNPQEGDFKKNAANITTSIPILTENADKWIPAFILYGNNAVAILAIIAAYGIRDAMVICKGNIDINDDNTCGLLESDEVSYITYKDDNSRSVNRKLRGLGKNLIRIDDKFNEQKKNADYLSIPEELFSDEHRYYNEENFWGFSDYTTLSKDFIDGGMLPYAIAIHLTYNKTTEEVWVRHFVSDTNDSPSNIHGKFFEAAVKVKSFFLDKHQTPAIRELISMVDQGKYPGLGVIKKLSIRNHIELMNQLLSVEL